MLDRACVHWCRSGKRAGPTWTEMVAICQMTSCHHHRQLDLNVALQIILLASYFATRLLSQEWLSSVQCSAMGLHSLSADGTVSAAWSAASKRSDSNKFALFTSASPRTWTFPSGSWL